MSRSFLFVPADSPREFERALQSSADALILDLEDSVSEAAKPQARDTIRQMLAAPRGDKAVWVRINPLDSGWALDDLRAVVGSRPFGIALPKSRGGADVVRLAHYLDAFESAADVPPGSVALFDSRLLSGATANRSDKPHYLVQAAYARRWFRDSTQGLRLAAARLEVGRDFLATVAPDDRGLFAHLRNAS